MTVSHQNTPVHVKIGRRDCTVDQRFPRALFGSHFPSRQVKPLGLKMLGLVAFSEPPSEATWLENAWLIAFSEPPSEATWLENAWFDRISRAAK